MKPFAIAASLLLAAPASAQSFFPNIYGSRFCELRRLGVEPSEARQVAMQEAWAPLRRPTPINFNGKQTTLDVLDASRFIIENCSELAK